MYWCERCAVPLLEPYCAICSGHGREMEIYHGLEIRPASPDTLKIIGGILDRQYGASGALAGKLVLMHKIPGIDRTEEIIMGGRALGVLAYLPEKGAFELALKWYGANHLAPLAKKGVVALKRDALHRHLKGKWVSPADVESHIGVESGVDAIITCGSFVGVGRPEFSSSGPMPEKCLKVRDIEKAQAVTIPDSRFADAAKANGRYIRQMERNAVNDLHHVLSNDRRPLTATFSGGKDSAVATTLLMQARKDFTLIYIDTGIEFPESMEYVRRFAQSSGLALDVLRGKESFWDIVKDLGPPAKDFRWCCKVCKLAPMAELVAAKYPKGVISVEGRRRAESFSRANIRLVEQNPFVPNQTLVNPIRGWSALDVWLYIYWKGIPYNPLYDRDFERIGCYLCPAEHDCEFGKCGELHPGLHDRWREFLVQWAAKRGAGREYYEQGIWRWKTLPPKLKALAGKMPKSGDVSLGHEIRRERDGTFVVQGTLRLPDRLGLDVIAESLGILGDIEYDRELGTAVLHMNRGAVCVFANGDMTSSARNESAAREHFKLAVQQLLRVHLCTGCGICVSACPVRAIALKDGRPVSDLDLCTRCRRCIEGCVIAKYYDKIATPGGMTKPTC